MTEQRRPDITILKQKFELFVMELSESIADLKQQVKSFNKPDLLPLDYSLESLDRIERAYAFVLDDVIFIQDKDIFTTRVGRYMGETLRRKVGGHWAMCEDSSHVCYGLPWLTDIPELPNFSWSPLSVVFNYRSHRTNGLLRKATEQIVCAVENNQK